MTRAVGTQEKLITSSHRAANQLANLTESFLRGGSAADLFAQATVGLEKVLHLPLGALAGLAVGAGAAVELAKIGEEAKKLRHELDLLASGGFGATPEFQTLSALEKQLEEMEKK